MNLHTAVIRKNKLTFVTVSSILDVLNSYSYLSTMAKMFDIAEIKNALGTGNNFTLLVPTNKAFKVNYVSSLNIVTISFACPFFK